MLYLLLLAVAVTSQVYILSPDDVAGCTGNSTMLTTKEECEAASDLYDQNWNREASFGHLPKGCFWHTNNEFYYNTHDTGALQSGARVVCLAPTVNCTLGAVPNPDDCKVCGMMPQSVTIVASGFGSCDAQSHMCIDGEGDCVEKILNCGEEITFELHNDYNVNQYEGGDCSVSPGAVRRVGNVEDCEAAATQLNKTWGGEVTDLMKAGRCFEDTGEFRNDGTGSGTVYYNSHYQSSLDRIGYAICPPAPYVEWTSPPDVTGLFPVFNGCTRDPTDAELCLNIIRSGDDQRLESTCGECGISEFDYPGWDPNTTYRMVIEKESAPLATITVKLLCAQTAYRPAGETFQYTLEDNESTYCGSNTDFQPAERMRPKECQDAATRMGLAWGGVIVDTATYSSGTYGMNAHCAMNIYTGVVRYNDIECGSPMITCDYDYNHMNMCKKHDAGPYCGQDLCLCGDDGNYPCYPRPMDCGADDSCAQHEVLQSFGDPVLVSTSMKCNAETKGWPNSPNSQVQGPMTLQDCVNTFADTYAYFSMRGGKSRWGFNHVYCFPHNDCPESDRVIDRHWSLYRIENITEYSCGNGICEAGETMETCSTDCASCRDWCNNKDGIANDFISWETKCQWNHCYSCEECYPQECECMDTWEHEFCVNSTMGVNGVQTGCVNCNDDRNGAWCVAKEADCRSVYRDVDEEKTSLGYFQCNETTPAEEILVGELLGSN